MIHTDLPEVVKIQQRCYSQSFWEDQSIFKEKLDLFPEGCFIAMRENRCVGYIFSHPWEIGYAPPLNKALCLFSLQCNCLHLHDCSIDPDARRNNFGADLVHIIICTARSMNLQLVQLVALPQSRRFWKNQGFSDMNSLSHKSHTHLKHYGDGALMMSLQFSKLH